MKMGITVFLIVSSTSIFILGSSTSILADHLGQIVCDKDGVVDWCIVLVEIPLTRFEEFWPLPTEPLPKFP